MRRFAAMPEAVATDLEPPVMPRSVLLVEDVEAMRLYLRYALERHGVQATLRELEGTRHPDWNDRIIYLTVGPAARVTVWSDEGFERESREWSEKNGGGIYELHSYILPDGLTDEEAVKKQLLKELYHFFPELEGMTIVHEYLQLRNDFTAYHTGLHADRPGEIAHEGTL